jgi:hypothetical protein
MGVGGQLHAPAALSSGKRPGTHCTGGWVGPRAGLDGCDKSRPHWDYKFVKPDLCPQLEAMLSCNFENNAKEWN